MKDDAVVIVIQRQKHEVVHSAWGGNRVKRHHQLTERGVHRGGVTLGCIDAHLGQFGKLLLFWCRAVERRKLGRHGEPR